MIEFYLNLFKNKDFEGAKKYMLDIVEPVNKKYERGLVLEEDCKRDINNKIIEAQFQFDQYFLGLRSNYEQTNAFIDDYNNWKNGVATEGKWLRKPYSEDVEYTLEEVYMMLDALYIPIEHYISVDPSIPNPQIYSYDFDSIGIQFKCVDDGGLLNDDNPVGKTFLLKREDGVTANIEVLEVSSRADRYHTPGMLYDVYSCQGTVDYYNVVDENPVKSDIRIEVIGDKKINHMTIFSAYYRNAPVADYYSTTKWHDYYVEQEKICKIRDEGTDRIIKKAIEDTK